MKRLYTLLLLLSLVAPVAHAQVSAVDSSYLMDAFTRTPFVFEGTTIYTESFTVPAESGGESWYTSSIVQVQKVFRGNLSCGTVEFITRGGTIGNVSYGSRYDLKLGVGTRNIFFADTSIFPDLNATVTNAIVLSSGYDNVEGAIHIIQEHGDFPDAMAVYGFYTNWQHLPDFYTYLQAMPNINRVDCPQPSPPSLFEVQDSSTTLKVYPNPTGSQLVVEQVLEKEGLVYINLLDASGKIIMTPMNGTRYDKGVLLKKELNISFLPPGVYHLQLVAGGEITDTVKLIKK